MTQLLLVLAGSIAGALVGLYLPELVKNPPSGPWWWCRLSQSLPPGAQLVPEPGTLRLAAGESGYWTRGLVGGLLGLYFPWLLLGMGVALQFAVLGTPLRHIRTVRGGEGDTVEVSMSWKAPAWQRTLSWTLTQDVYRMLGQAHQSAQQAGRELSCLYLLAELAADPDLVPNVHAALTLPLQARQAAAREQSTRWGQLFSRWKYRTMLREAEASMRGPLTVRALLRECEAACEVCRRLLQESRRP